MYYLSSSIQVTTYAKVQTVQEEVVCTVGALSGTDKPEWN